MRNKVSDIGQMPPQAVDLEESVIAGLTVMATIEDLILVFEILKPSDFYKEQNRIIFKALFEMFINDQKIDFLTLVEKLKKDGNLEAVGGVFYISEICEKVGSNANIEVHARIIKQKSISREQIDFGSRLVSMAYDVTNDCFDVNDYMMARTNEIINGIEVNKEKSIDEVLKSIEKNMALASLNGGYTGILTGFTELDKAYLGRQKGDLIIKAGRPAMGKTSQAICEAVHQAYNLGKHVLFFSLEMQTEKLVLRAISVMTNIPLGKLQRGELNEMDWSLFFDAYLKIQEGTLYFFDSKFKISEIVATCKKMKLSNTAEIIYIDYLQLIEAIDKKNSIREQEISSISRALKQLAKSVDCPIIALAQLSRAVEGRGGSKKPQLSDLRESGAIEQDADVVEFVYRPEYYGITQNEHGESMKGIAYILIAKNRNGSCEDVPMRFIDYLTKFEDLNAGMSTYNEDIEPNELF